MAFQKFSPLMNIEYTLRLASVEGTQKKSQFGKDQVLLRVDVIAPADKAMSDASWYSYPWIVERLQKAGVRANEPFRFCTAQNGNKSELRIVATSNTPPESDEIEETDLTRKMRESTEIAKRQTPTLAPQSHVVTMPKPPAGGPTVHTLASQALAGCLIAAIDATVTAAAYADKKGVSFAPTAETIQDLASTLFINLSKMGGGLQAMAPNPEQQQLVNGGTKWAQ